MIYCSSRLECTDFFPREQQQWFSTHVHSNCSCTRLRGWIIRITNASTPLLQFLKEILMVLVKYFRFPRNTRMHFQVVVSRLYIVVTLNENDVVSTSSLTQRFHMLLSTSYSLSWIFSIPVLHFYLSQRFFWCSCVSAWSWKWTAFQLQ